MQPLIPDTLIATQPTEELEKQVDQLHKTGNTQDAMVLQGYLYQRRKDFQKAIQCFERAQRWQSVADMYLHLGQEKKYHHYFAKYLLSQNLHKQAAASFSKAESFIQAAQTFKDIFDYKNAIKAFVQANEIHQAGQLLVQLGHPSKAARLYENAHNFSQAILHYKKAGSWDDLIRVYDRSRQYLEAMEASLKINHLQGALHFLGKIDKTQGKYLQAFHSLLLHCQTTKNIDLFLKYFYELMFDKDVNFDHDYFFDIGVLLEQADFPHEGLQVYRRLVYLGRSSPDLNQRILHIEKKLQFLKKKKSLRAYHNRFLLYQLIGKGAMSKVYKAKDTLSKKWVALKIISTDSNDDELDRFQSFFQEAQTTANLHHPNIIEIYDFGVENNHLFISMEHLDGETLQYLLKKVKRINLVDFLFIAQQICEALIYAHDMFVVHRDIKPSNIMLLKKEKAKLMDFGIAKVANTSNHVSIERGTPKYVSPEQILGIQTTPQSDIYSLGVVFYEMLAGHPPFPGSDAMNDHINVPPARLDTVAQDVPFELVNIIMKCLAKKPDRRPKNVAQILDIIFKLKKAHFEPTPKDHLTF